MTHYINHTLTFIGPAGAGRSVLLQRKSKGIFELHNATIGANREELEFKQHPNKKFIFWDTCYNPDLLTIYLTQASIVIICYDASNENSMESVKQYFEICEKNQISPKRRILLGLQIDSGIANEKLPDEMMSTYGYAFHMNVSAKENINVDEFFDRAVDYCIEYENEVKNSENENSSKCQIA